MSSTIIDVAEAVKNVLDGTSFSVPFAAKRGYRPAQSLESLKTLTVTVVPKEQGIEPLDRGNDAFEVAVDVAVQQKLTAPDGDELETELDTLMSLVQEIVDRLRRLRLDVMPAAAWKSIENDPIFDPEHLAEKRVFTSLLTVTYRVKMARA